MIKSYGFSFYSYNIGIVHLQKLYMLKLGGVFHLCINVWVADKTAWPLIDSCHTWTPLWWVLAQHHIHILFTLLTICWRWQ